MVFNLLRHSIGFDLQVLCDHLPDFRSGPHSKFFVRGVQGNFYDSTGNPLHVTGITQPALSPRPANQLQIPLDHPNWLILAQHGPFPVHWLKIHVVDRLKKSLETHLARSEPARPLRGVLGVPFDSKRPMFLIRFVAFCCVFPVFLACFCLVLGHF
jgi:hypothetical protein